SDKIMLKQGVMNAYALHHAADDALALRWSSSALAIATLHVAAVALLTAFWYRPPPPGVTLPAIMVDMAPATSAPQSTPLDLAPGPIMQQADASPPEVTKQEAVEDQIAPTPPQEKAEVVAPPEQKQASPQKPEPAKVAPEQKLAPVKPKVVRADATKPSEAPPAPRTTAAPKAEREAPAASAVSSGASAAAVGADEPRGSRPLQR